jgi:cell division protein FtsL
VDDFKPNKSVDGMMGGAGAPPKEPENNYMNNNQSNDAELSDLGPANETPATPNNYAHENNDLHISGHVKDPSKKFKVLTIIFALLFIAASVFAYFQYSQVQDLQKQLDESNAKVQMLNSELDSIKYDTKDATKKQELATKKLEAYQALAKQLKDACGRTCNDISLEVKVTN